MQVMFPLETVYVPVGMGEGCGARVGLTVIAVDGMVVWVSGRIVVLVMVVAVRLSGTVVRFPDPVVGFPVFMVVAVVATAADVICVFGGVCFMVESVAVAVISVLTCVLPCLVEDIECTVVFFTAAVTISIAWVVGWPAAVVLSADVVDTTVGDFWPVTCVVVAPSWAVVTWCWSVVCTVMLWLMGVVLREPVLLKWAVVPWWLEEWLKESGWAEVVVWWKAVASGDSSVPRATSAKQEENAARNK